MIEFSSEDVEDDAVVLCPRGRLNLLAASQLREVLARTVAAGRTHVVVDLSQTAFLDSSGLGALVAGLKTARQAGGDLRLACLPPQAEMVVKLTNLDRVLRPYASVEDALGGR